MRLLTERTAHLSQYAKVSMNAIVGAYRDGNAASTRSDELTRLTSDTQS